jgi:hypothetical protein
MFASFYLLQLLFTDYKRAKKQSLLDHMMRYPTTITKLDNRTVNNEKKLDGR